MNNVAVSDFSYASLHTGINISTEQSPRRWNCFRGGSEGSMQDSAVTRRVAGGTLLRSPGGDCVLSTLSCEVVLRM